MKNSLKKISPIVILAILLVAIILAAAGSYYLLKQAGKVPEVKLPAGFNLMGSPAPISDSDEVEDLQKEFEDTKLEGIDSEVQELESSANSL